MENVAQSDLRKRLIEWILKMRNTPGWEDYASDALKRYAAQMPWLRLNAGVKEAMVKQIRGNDGKEKS